MATALIRPNTSAGVPPVQPLQHWTVPSEMSAQPWPPPPDSAMAFVTPGIVAGAIAGGVQHCTEPPTRRAHVLPPPPAEIDVTPVSPMTSFGLVPIEADIEFV